MVVHTMYTNMCIKATFANRFDYLLHANYLSPKPYYKTLQIYTPKKNYVFIYVVINIQKIVKSPSSSARQPNCTCGYTMGK